MTASASEPILSFGRNTTLHWSCQTGDHVLWMRWANSILSVSNDPAILDLWEMKDSDSIIITNRVVDLPTWFELHPTEVSGSNVYWMLAKLKAGYKPAEPVEGPNLWRILAGDRVVWMGRDRPERASVDGVVALVDFEENALAFGESRRGDTDLVSFISFGALSEQSQRPEAQSLVRAGIAAVRKLGLPRALAVDEWTLG